MHAFIHAHTHACFHTYIHACTHIYIHTFILAYTHAYIVDNIYSASNLKGTFLTILVTVAFSIAVSEVFVISV